MAKVVPYADPNAHGTLGESVTFRRRGPKVLMEAVRNPVDRKSAAQLLQREKISQASKAYNLISGATKYYFRKRGTQRSRTGKDYYLKKYLANRMPSTTHKTDIQSIQDMVLFDCVGVGLQDIKFTLISLDSSALNYFLWNKLDAAAGGIIESGIGGNGTVVQPITFAPVHFDNGVKGWDRYSTVAFPNDNYSMNQGVISFWFKTKKACVNGVMEGTQAGSKIWLNQEDYWEGGVSAYLGLTFRDIGGRAEFLVEILSHGALKRWRPTGANWPAETPTSFFMIYDRLHGFDGLKTVSIYINGMEIFSETATWQSTENYVYPIKLCSSSYRQPSEHGTDTFIDNLKMSNSIDQFSEMLADVNVEAGISDTLFGSIYDNENIFLPDANATVEGKTIVTIENLSGEPRIIPFRAFTRVSYTRLDDEEKEGYLRLPELHLTVEPVTLYIATDWSTYFDDQMHRLAASYWV